MAALAPRKPQARELPDLSGLVLADPPRPLPELAFQDEHGASRTLTDARGKGLVLNLWATWCAPCVAELPELDRLAAALHEAGIAVWAASSDQGEAGRVRQFYQTHDIRDLPVLLDPEGRGGQTLGIGGIPTTILIEATGRERARLEGAAAWGSEAALRRVRKLLGQQDGASQAI